MAKGGWPSSGRGTGIEETQIGSGDHRRHFRSELLLLSAFALFPWMICAQNSPTPLTLSLQAQNALDSKQMAVAERDFLLSAAAAEVALGDIALENGQPENAVGLYEQARPTLGLTRELIIGKATALSQLGRTAEATAALKGFLVVHPDDWAVRRLLGETLATAGQMRAALAEFESALRRSPKDAETLYMAGAASLKLNIPENAESKFAQLAAVVPGAATEVLIGRTYLDLHFDVEAAAHLRKALGLDPRVQRAHFYLAILDIMHEGSVNLPEAAREFKAELVTYPTDYQSNLYAGVVLEQEHLSAEAQPYLIEAVKERPDSADGYVYLANCYFEQGNYQGAVEAADEAIRLTPDPSIQNFRIAGTHFILAQALRNLGESARAEQEARTAQSLKQRANSASQDDLTKYLAPVKQPEDAPALDSSVHWVHQQLSHEQEKANQETRRQLNQLLDDDLFNLGVLYLKQEKLEQAAAEFAAVFQQNPQYPGIARQYGMALFLLDKFKAAIPVLRQAVDSTPADEDSRSLLGQAFSKVGNYAEAARVLSGVRWHDIPTLYALAISLARSGNDAGSARVFSVLLDEHKDSAEIEALLGQAASEQQLYTEAVQHFRKALALDPKVPEAHLGIGLIAMRNGELAAANREIRLELASHSGDLRAVFYLAYVLGLQQKHEEATRLLRKIVAQRPEFPEAHATLGSELMAQNRPREALDELLLADKLDPDQAKLQYQIGQAYRKLGQPQEAEKSFALFRELQKREAEKQTAGRMGGEDLK